PSPSASATAASSPPWRRRAAWTSWPRWATAWASPRRRWRAITSASWWRSTSPWRARTGASSASREAIPGQRRSLPRPSIRDGPSLVGHDQRRADPRRGRGGRREPRHGLVGLGAPGGRPRGPADADHGFGGHRALGYLFGRGDVDRVARIAL